jgi:hypothetical protein
VATVVGRDGRDLVTAREAAYSLGFGVNGAGRFKTWASRRGVRSKASRWRSGPGRGESLFDLADIDAARSRPPGQREPADDLRACQVDVTRHQE